MSAIVLYFERSLALPFFGIGMKTDLFPVLWPLLSFPNLLAYWVQHFHSIIFQELNSSTVIPSPPLALFIVMLPKAHLTSHSRMSGSRWVITPLWLSGSLRSFHSFAFFRMSYSWNHTGCILFRLASFTHFCLFLGVVTLRGHISINWRNRGWYGHLCPWLSLLESSLNWESAPEG